MSEQNYWTRMSGRRLSRRGVLRGSAVAGLGLAGAALIGCGDDDDDEAPAAQAPAPATPAAPGAPAATAAPGAPEVQIKKGGIFRKHNTRSLGGLFDPHVSLNDQLQFWPYLGQYPAAMSKDGTEITGELLESWEIPGDGTEIIFKVNQKAKWHDRGAEAGRAFDAEDAVYNLMRITGKLDPENFTKYFGRSVLVGMDRAEAIDDGTIKVTMEHPTSTFFAGLSYYRTPWASRQFEAEGGDWTDAESLVGTGAFTIEKFENDVIIEYKANPNYWKPGQPYLDGLEIVWVPDTTSAIAAFAQGDIDYISASNKIARATITKLAPDAVEQRWPHINWNHWRFQVNRKPFDDPRVRLALQRIPRYGQMAEGYNGEGYWTYAGSLTPAYPGAISSDEISTMPGWNPDTKEADIKDGVQLMAAAGFPDGELDFELMPASSNQESAYFDMAVRVQDQLKDVWPQMKTSLKPPPDFASFGHRQTGGDFDSLFYVIHGVPDSVLEMISAHGTQRGLFGGRNYGEFSDAEVDRLLGNALRELDIEARNVILRQIQLRLINELMPTIGFYAQNLVVYYGDHVVDNEGAGRLLSTPSIDLAHYADQIWLNV